MKEVIKFFGAWLTHNPLQLIALGLIVYVFFARIEIEYLGEQLEIKEQQLQECLENNQPSYQRNNNSY